MINTNKLIACLRELGIKPDVNSFTDKLIIQKTCYLLQAAGIDMGFGYGLYVRGPYSPSLTKELYENKPNFEGLKTGFRLSSRELKAIFSLKEFFENDPALLEIAATYVFFRKDSKMDPLAAEFEIRRFKSFFKGIQIAKALNSAKEMFFPPTKEEIEDMKKEFRGWESLSMWPADDK